MCPRPCKWPDIRDRQTDVVRRHVRHASLVNASALWGRRYNNNTVVIESGYGLQLSNFIVCPLSSLLILF